MSVKIDLLASFYNEEAHGGIRHFINVPPRVIQMLVESGEADLAETQNDSPSIEDMLELGENIMGGRFMVHGYRTNDDGYNVVLEGFRVAGPISAVEICWIVGVGRHADEFEIDPEEGAYAWWD